MLKISQYKHIIWDWNGTLLNDAWLFVDVMNGILKNRNMNTITIDQYRDIFGFPVKDYYVKLGFDLDKESFKKSGLEFIHAYEKRRYEAKLYPGVVPLLTKLISKQISHSILSAQHQLLLEDLIEYYNIQKYFIQINGLNNHYAQSKIKLGLEWMQKNEFDPNEVILIGDTDHDFEVAQAIGTDCLLISDGHHSHSRLVQTGTTVIHKLEHVFDLLKKSTNVAHI